jgi:4-hydroxymandelate oxidase
MTAPREWPLNLADLEAPASERLDPSTYDYYRSGAGDEITLARNRTAFEELRLLPHVLRDVSEIGLETEVLGTPMSMSVAVAPTAFHALADPLAEPATARGAAAADAVFCLSSLSNTPLEDVAAVSGRQWFQLYVFRDRGLTRDLVERAAAAGYGALLVTVDAPVLGRRERDVRNAFELPEDLTIACVGDAVAAGEGESGLAAYFAAQLDPALTWSDLEWLAEISGLPVAVKGVHRPDDAERAIEHGAAGIVVSNHGARQLDTVPATIEMLPALAEAVAGRGEVLLDGGVRRGTDVVKALALGAAAVMIGRPILWGLALDGEQGVRRTLNMLRLELREAMALCGVASVAEIDAELLAPQHRA